MGIFDYVRRSAGDLFIASPPEAARALIWKHPDPAIPRGAKLTVRSDESTVFFRDGRPVGVLGPGVHSLETENIPFLNNFFVAPFTGNRHAITELFFIRTAEHLHTTHSRRLGTFTDLDSQLVVGLEFEARFSLRVHNPITLITTLGGQNAASTEGVLAFVDGRLTTVISSALGQMCATEPVLRITSNQYSEPLGKFVLEQSRNTFLPEGIEVLRFVELTVSLDPSSEASLRAFGQKRAEMNLQREGAELASQPGFAQWNLVQGQRAALEGLAQGLAQGNVSAPLIGLGVGPTLGLGAPAPLPLPQASVFAKTSAQSLRVSGPPRWYVRTSKGIEGPLSARQVVLRASHLSLDADHTEVRAENSSVWNFAADHTDLAVAFERREAAVRPKLTTHGTQGSALFEQTLASALGDGVLTDDELSLLASLAESTGLASASTAREYVSNRARALLSPPRQPAPELTPELTPELAAPPAPTVKTYVYSNGLEQSRGLTAEAVARRVMASPDGVHNVWAPGMPAWVSALELDDIRRLLGR